MKDLFAEMLEHVIHHAPHSLDQGGQLFVACSGGVDSMLLLELLDQAAAKKAWRRPVVLHVNYGLRGEDSQADEQLVRSEAKRRGLICHVRRLEASDEAKLSGDSGIQAWARELRRQWFESWLSAEDVVAVAHHQDDLAENILMRLGRGSGLRIAGMQLFKAPYWRPLLPWGKDSIRMLASRQKVSFREDASNAKLDYSRNYVRWKVIPEYQARFPDLVPKLTAFADDLGDLADFLEEHFADWITAPYLLASQLQKQKRGVGFFILAAFLKRQIGYYQLSRAQLDRLWQVIQKAAVQPDLQWSEDLVGQYRISLRSDRITVTPRKKSFGLRAQQHRANIRRHTVSLWLESGATAQVDFTCLKRHQADCDVTTENA